MDIRPTDARSQDANEYVINSKRRFWNVLEPEAPFGARFDESFHGQAW